MKVGKNKSIHVFHPLKTFDLNVYLFINISRSFETEITCDISLRNMQYALLTNVPLIMTTFVLVATCIICYFSII